MSRVLNPLIMKNAGFDIEEYTGKLKSTVSQETIESTTVMISMLNWCKDVVASGGNYSSRKYTNGRLN